MAVLIADEALMRHGYAEEDYNSIRFSFEYTEAQKEVNHRQAEEYFDALKWDGICQESA